MSVTITVCAGSSCHVRGSRRLIARFAELIRRRNLQERVSLVGCFCMDRCGEHINWKFNEEELSSRSLQEAEATLLAKLERAGSAADSPPEQQ